MNIALIQWITTKRNYNRGHALEYLELELHQYLRRLKLMLSCLVDCMVSIYLNPQYKNT